MSFLAPWNLLWLGLLAPLVLLYILKRKREEKVIGSTLLWEQALADLRAERPWQRLIPRVSLLLQILVIVLGALALARPVGAGGVPQGARVAVVIDVSASMGARRSDETTRLELCVSRARNLARTLPPGGELMVVEAGRTPTVRQVFSADATQIERALAEVHVRGPEGDLEASLAVASERLRGAMVGSQMLLCTDRAADGQLSLDGTSMPVELLDASVDEGGAPSNTGIVDADVRARPSEGVDHADVFARVAHFGPTPADVHVTASIDGEGRILGSRRVTVPNGETSSVLFGVELPPSSNGVAPLVRIALSAESEGERDALALDDVAVVPSPGSRRVPVFLVGDTAGLVRRVFRSDENVELFSTTLDALAERDEPDEPLDGLVVYSGATPEDAPPGDSLVLAPSGDQVFEMALGDAIESPRIVTWDDADPRLRFVGLREVHLGSARAISGGGATALVTASIGPIVSSVERPDGETTLLAFDPMQTDWPRDPSFVVFFRNVLERARDRRAAGGIPQGELGEALRVPAPDGEEVTVETPSGDELTAVSRGGVAIVPVPADPGAYRVDAAGRPLRAMRNLLSAVESNLEPRLSIRRGGTEAGVGEASQTSPTESWPWFALALLLILVLEITWATRGQSRARRAA